MISSGKGFFNLPLLGQLAIALILGGLGITFNTDAGLLWQLPTVIALLIATRAIEFLNTTEARHASWREGSWFYLQLLGTILAILFSAAVSLSAGLFIFVIVNPTIFEVIDAAITKTLDAKTAKWPESAKQTFDRLSKAMVVILTKSLLMQSGSKVLAKSHVATGVTEYTISQLLAIASGFTTAAQHTIADGITAAVRERSIEQQLVKDVRMIPGVGITGLIDSSNFALGTAALLTSRGVNIAVQDLVVANNANEAGRTVLFLIRDKQLIGLFELSEELNETAEWLVYDLADAGKRVVLVTSDSTGVANAIAKKLSIEEVHAELLPPQKAELIARFGTEPVFEVTADDYDQISTLVRLSKRIAAKRKQSTLIAAAWMAFGYGIALITASVDFAFDEPVAAALLASVASTVVVYNSKSLGK